MEIILKLFTLPFLVENFLLTSIHVNEVHMHVHVCGVYMYICTGTQTQANMQTYIHRHTYFEEKMIHLLKAYCILGIFEYKTYASCRLKQKLKTSD